MLLSKLKQTFAWNRWVCELLDMLHKVNPELVRDLRADGTARKRDGRTTLGSVMPGQYEYLLELAPYRIWARKHREEVGLFGGVETTWLVQVDVDISETTDRTDWETIYDRDGWSAYFRGSKAHAELMNTLEYLRAYALPAYRYLQKRAKEEAVDELRRLQLEKHRRAELAKAMMKHIQPSIPQ